MGDHGRLPDGTGLSCSAPSPSVSAVPASIPSAEVLTDIAAMMSEFVENWPNPKQVSTALALVAKTMRAALNEQAALERAIDRMGWPEIHAYQAELRKGQAIDEDAGGFMIRAIARLFGIQQRRDPVVTYRDSVRAMVSAASAMSAGTAETETGSGLQPASAIAASETPNPEPSHD